MVQEGPSTGVPVVEGFEAPAAAELAQGAGRRTAVAAEQRLVAMCIAGRQIKDTGRAGASQMTQEPAP